MSAVPLCFSLLGCSSIRRLCCHLLAGTATHKLSLTISRRRSNYFHPSHRAKAYSTQRTNKCGCIVNTNHLVLDAQRNATTYGSHSYAAVTPMTFSLQYTIEPNGKLLAVTTLSPSIHHTNNPTKDFQYFPEIFGRAASNDAKGTMFSCGTIIVEHQ